MNLNRENSITAVWVVTGESCVPMALASSATFRVCHPQAKIQWLASKTAYSEWKKLVPEWLRDRFEVHVYSDGLEDDVSASRRLKLGARQLVNGNFIQVDADILFVKPLELDYTKIPFLAACLNRDSIGQGIEDTGNSWARGIFFALSWPWVEHYFNTGFIVWKDVPEAYAFSRRWKEVREEFQNRTGHYIDQPAFNKAAAEMGCVSLLDTRYNAPVTSLPKLARGAFCYHYYTVVAKRFPNSTTLEWLASKFENRASDSRESVEAFIRNPQPFRGWTAPSHFYWQSGQLQNFLERELRIRLNMFKNKLRLKN